MINSNSPTNKFCSAWPPVRSPDRKLLQPCQSGKVRIPILLQEYFFSALSMAAVRAPNISILRMRPWTRLPPAGGIITWGEIHQINISLHVIFIFWLHFVGHYPTPICQRRQAERAPTKRRRAGKRCDCARGRSGAKGKRDAPARARAGANERPRQSQQEAKRNRAVRCRASNP